ncbi:inovirus Gp2 family protein [Vibrio cholerae]|uniref:inovirus Gp2 family protein n=2 Tax=Vibrio cholerae TaxID=666 RepID=UPI000F0B4B55|nr:inovirus Gp2 family protein [Vibrio cholerae]MBJ6948621.1 inovirus Gp2 family protein [Vibrio cholerae]RNE59628.1 inovirus Gp2 family protein [Vibrio cholerae]GHY93278.1 transposase [Vibrio cholerae]HDB1439947.1 inovirus Gp2 family protein [Vibrio cholerae]HDB1450554.1 inovirus Gp2 family protein [Vibrio cholerae]
MKTFLSNPNLTMINESEFMSFPITTNNGNLARQYLYKIKETLDLSLTEHHRIYVQRVDLRYPKNFFGYNSYAITRFIESLKSKIESDLNRKKKNGKCKLRYVWAREQACSETPHYHVALILNKDVYFCLGNFSNDNGNLSSMIKEAWASALGIEYFQVENSVHFPKNSTYYIHKGRESYLEEYRQCFYRLSYLAKIDTKIYSNGLKNFSTSRK